MEEIRQIIREAWAWSPRLTVLYVVLTPIVVWGLYALLVFVIVWAQG
jgi:hypothetical protein